MNCFQLSTNVGTVEFTWNQSGLLSHIRWVSEDFDPNQSKLIATGRLPRSLFRLFERFEAYFETGEPIGELPWESIDRSQWSEFQRNVYETTAQIPHGETRSYSWVAARSGNLFATRAVGQALRKNPLPILIACHRVISSTDGLGGFMGNSDPGRPELRLKRRLIEIEETYRNPVFPFLIGTDPHLALGS